MEKTSDISPMASEPAKEPEAQPTDEYKSKYESAQKQLSELAAWKAEQEKAHAEKEAAEKAKKGQWEQLYQEQKEQLEKERENNKKYRIESDLKMQAKDMGLKKLEYLALMDREGISLSETGEIVGMAEKLETFKKKYPEFFAEGGENASNNEERIRVPYTDSKRIITKQSVHYSNDDQLREQYKSTTDGRAKRRMLGEFTKNKLAKHIKINRS